jgi:tryptophan synthase alpha chain
MNRIDNVFKKKNTKALIAYVTIGYPSIEVTKKVVPLLAESGCDIVELGIPFSDPLADGATIQHSSFHSLQSGVTPQLCIELVEQLRREVNIPLVFMTYYNLVFQYGINKFCFDSARVGIDGIIVPDLTPDEGLELETISCKHNIDLIYLLAPTSTEERIEMVTQRSRGFIYLVSITGTTGAREKLATNLDVLVTRIKNKTSKPVCVGFGISSPEQAAQITRVADGVIIGSKIIQLIQLKNGFASICGFINNVRRSLNQA